MNPGRVPLPDPPLLVITDRGQARAPLPEIAEAVFRAGVRWLMLREKDLDAVARRDLLCDLVARGARFGATVTVNGDLAAAEAAAGLHLPAGGDIEAVRRALGPGALLGASAHSLEEATTAAAAGADYVTLSPVFESASKPGYGPALGPAGLGGGRGRGRGHGRGHGRDRPGCGGARSPGRTCRAIRKITDGAGAPGRWSHPDKSRGAKLITT